MKRYFMLCEFYDGDGWHKCGDGEAYDFSTLVLSSDRGLLLAEAVACNKNADNEGTLLMPETDDWRYGVIDAAQDLEAAKVAEYLPDSIVTLNHRQFVIALQSLERTDNGFLLSHRLDMINAWHRDAAEHGVDVPAGVQG